MGIASLSMSYRPITSTPFPGSGNYREIPPCATLKPYIRCFWGQERPRILSETAGRLVIPDTCMDIIVRVHPASHTVSTVFCAMDERPYWTEDADARSAFGIRFFCWSAVLFGAGSFRHTKNRAFCPDAFFQGITVELTGIVSRFHTLQERAQAAEKLLLCRLNENRMNCDLMNAISDMITYRGRRRISEIARQNALSERKMERIFAENVGVSPKTLSNLIRYQLVWQEMTGGSTDISDLVEKYGYADQAHLLNDFRFRHGMTPARALRL